MLRKLLVLWIRLVLFCIFAPLIALRIVYQRYKFGPVVFEKKTHVLPEKLTKEYSHKFVKLSSVKLHYVEAGPLSAPPIIMIHGFPEFWYAWRHQIKHFSKDYRVIAIDMRGYGESEKPEGTANYQVRVLANDVKELIEELGYKKATIAAHDWGAVVAWYTSLFFPEVVDKLVILNVPHPGAMKHVIRANPKQLLCSWYIFFFQTPFLPELMMSFFDCRALGAMFRGRAGLINKERFTNEDQEAWMATYSEKGVFTPPLNYYRALFDCDRPTETRLKTKAPTLIIWGEQDIALVKECAAKSAERCENAQVVYVPNSSHWVQQDEPDIVNKAMEEFLAKHE